jgi:hypothetical protein
MAGEALKTELLPIALFFRWTIRFESNYRLRAPHLRIGIRSRSQRNGAVTRQEADSSSESRRIRSASSSVVTASRWARTAFSSAVTASRLARIAFNSAVTASHLPRIALNSAIIASRLACAAFNSAWRSASRVLLALSCCSKYVADRTSRCAQLVTSRSVTHPSCTHSNRPDAARKHPRASK